MNGKNVLFSEILNHRKLGGEVKGDQTLFAANEL